MSCRDVMNPRVTTCRLDAFVSDCGRLMGERDVAYVPVLDYQNRLIGLLTDRDLALRVVGEHRSADTRVSSVMSTDVAFCSPEDSLETVEAQMLAAQRPFVVVIDRERHVLGVVGLADIARQEPLGRAAEALRAPTFRGSPRVPPQLGLLR